MMEYPLARFGMTGECPPPIGPYNPSITPFGILETADAAITIAVGNDKLWTLLCDVMHRPDLLADPRYETNPLRTENRTPLYAELTNTLKTKTSTEWLDLFVNAGIPAARVNTVADVFHDSHVRARGMVQSVLQPNAGEVAIAGSPVRIGNSETPQARPAPQLGQHTNAILGGWLGLSDDEIAKLRTEGAL